MFLMILIWWLKSIRLIIQKLLVIAFTLKCPSRPVDQISGHEIETQSLHLNLSRRRFAIGGQLRFGHKAVGYTSPSVVPAKNESREWPSIFHWINL